MSNIQEISAQTISEETFFEQAVEDYSAASITLLYTRKKSGSRRLLFSVVELTPEWIEPSEELDVCKTIDSRAGLELNLRRISLTPGEALRWYSSCRENAQIVLPATRRDKEAGFDKKHRELECGRLAEEPAFPTFIATNSHEYFWDQSAFWGRYPGGIRWHQLRGERLLAAREIWPDESTEAIAREWLKGILPFDLLSRSMLLPSVHLVLANPVFRTLTFRPSMNDPYQMVLKIEKAKSSPPLKCYLREYRPNGATQFIDFVLQKDLAVIRCPYEFHSVGLDIVCPIRGLLYSCRPSPFLKSISIGIGMISKQRVIQIPSRSKNRGQSEHVAHVVGHVSQVNVGKASTNSALSVVSSEKYKIKNMKLAETLEQAWFNGDIDQATKYIRNIVTKSDDLLIVDPYFSHVELRRFALAASNSTAKIRILTSKELVSAKLKSGRLRTQGDILWDELKHVKSVDPDLSGIEIRVMQGSRPEIHDRFLKTPNAIWMIGSSLNEFGSRGTVSMKVPYPDPISEALENAWADAASLEFLLSKRKGGKS